MRRFFHLFAAVLVSGLLSLSAAFSQDSTYAPWQPPGQTQTGDMQQLLKQLRILIGKAEKAKAADPIFLKDLRKLADSYDNPWPITLLYDDFQDGDFTYNPAWTVASGTWRIDTQGVGGLQTRVRLQQTSSTGQGGSSTQNAVVGILGALLQPQQSGQTQQQPQDQSAQISTAVQISNNFNLHLEIAPRDSTGRFDFGLYRGANHDSGYFLTYMPGAANGLTLWSVVSGQASKQIGATSGALNMGNGAVHVIDWKRDRDGKMTITTDGNPAIEVTDLSLRKSFDGFVMANAGGTYTIHSVTILGSR